MNTLFRLPPCGGTAPGRVLFILVLTLVSPLSADPGPSVVLLEGLHDDNVSALAWDGEVLWVGTFDAGLARWHDGRWTKVPIAGAPKHRWINTLAWDGEKSPRRGASGTLWVGSAGGLAHWSAESGLLETLEEIEGPINSIRNESGTLVITGNDRLWIRRDDGWDIMELPGETLHAAFASGETLWTGGMWGALERRGGDWQRYSELNGKLPHSWVTALLPVGDEVWAGTYDAGLLVLAGDGPVRMQRSDAWVNFNALTRTRNGVAVGTMEDGLLLWNAANRSWRRLTVADGLPSDDVTAIVEVGERLWVGTRGGVAAVR